MTGKVPLRIGTRGSPLALAQVKETRDRLCAGHPDLAEPGAVEVVAIKTTGDRVTDRSLAEIGGKSLFTKEIDEALLSGAVDIAVHSMKDVPTWLPDGLIIGCLLPREDPRDVLCSDKADSIAALPPGAVIGTASLRRQAQVLGLRPDLEVVTLRGNVETRLRKLAKGEVDATLLALAGLRRLGLADRATAVLDPDEILPAIAQGAIGIACRADDAHAQVLLAPLNHVPTAARVAAERALLAVLDGSCHTPIAGLAEVEGDGALGLRGMLAMPDGSAILRVSRHGGVADAEAMGRDAGEELRRTAGPEFFTALG